MNHLQVIIDADACPQACLRIVKRLEKEFAYETVTVASFNHRISNPRHLVVGNEPQATDMAVINLTRPGDIVVTQDWGLAALVLAKQGRAIAPDGRIYESAQMGQMLEIRSQLAKIRRSGGRIKGPPKRTGSDDARFEAGLIRLLQSRV